jgi:hypothetical protein
MADTELLNFDAMYLGFENDKPGGAHIKSESDLAKLRDEEEDHALLLSEQAEKFCRLIVLFGKLPSEAYELAFSTEVTEYDENNQPRLTVIKPDLPAFQSRVLLKQPETKERIDELRKEVREWTKTEVAEVEMSYRSIMLNPAAKDADRIAAGKALAALRGFDAQPELMPGAQITIQLPFVPQQLTSHRIIEGEATDERAA